MKIRGVLERVIVKNFEKIEIPGAWLLLSLAIRGKKLRTMSLQECEKLAAKLSGLEGAPGGLAVPAPSYWCAPVLPRDRGTEGHSHLRLAGIG